MFGMITYVPKMVFDRQTRTCTTPRYLTVSLVLIFLSFTVKVAWSFLQHDCVHGGLTNPLLPQLRNLQGIAPLRYFLIQQ